MCGIYGFISSKVAISDITKLNNILKHRGPDDSGLVTIDIQTHKIAHYKFDDTIEELHDLPLVSNGLNFTENHLIMGHRRLAIIDLSPKGHQPMEFEGYIIVYNGEVYNYIELRKELEEKGWSFNTNSDTEVVLKSYIEYGEECVKRFNGMWAFAIWDPKREVLFLSRDRYGIKPLYYFFDGKNFAFASEIKALVALSFVPKSPNMEGVKQYLVWGSWEHREETMFEGIQRLLPAHNLIFDLKKKKMNFQKYYEITPNLKYEKFSERKLNEYAEKLRELFIDSVRLRLRSDVRVGTSFSGGIDSSGIVYTINKLLKEENPRSIGDIQYTFSSVYKTEKYKYVDESKWIEIALKDTNAKGIWIEPKVEDLINDIEKLVYYQDEPFNSTSIFAGWSVMKLPRKYNVIVTLDGQGGDEIFAGYLTYIPTMFNENLHNFRIFPALSMLINMKRITNFNFGQFLKIFISGLFPKRVLKLLTYKLNKQLFDNEGEYIEYKGRKHLEWRNINRRLKSDVEEGLVRLLRYSDRNSMAYSIESRVPWLDYRLVDFAFSIPSCYKVYKGWTKYIERFFLRDIVNHKIIWRRDKLGFPTPESEWLKELETQFTGFISRSKIINEMKIKENILKHLTFNPEVVSLGYGWKLINIAIWERKFEF